MPVPPVISSSSGSPTDTTALISWSTDEPATSAVEYGLTDAYELGSVEDFALLIDHSVNLTELIPGMKYHYQVVSVDESGNSSSSGDLTFTTVSDLAELVSDDFSSPELNEDLWTFVDPLGDATLTMTGTQVEILVPADSTHSFSSDGIFVPHLMQSTNDTDFEIEVKFDSPVEDKYQIEGVLIKQDSDNFLRLEFQYNGFRTILYATTFSSGTALTKSFKIISNGAPLYMRVKRQGDQWTQSYSYDGKVWTTARTFNYGMAVTEVGLYAGNAGTSVPEHTAVIDYFFNTSSPIEPEDGL